MKTMVKNKSEITEGCRKYFVELVDKLMEEDKADWKTFAKITRMDDSTLRRWYSGDTIQDPNLGNMLAAIISLGGTAMQALSYSGCSKLAFIVSVLEKDPELVDAVHETLNSPYKEKLKEEALFIQAIVKKSK